MAQVLVVAEVRRRAVSAAVVQARGGDAMSVFTTATRPTPSADWIGRIIYVRDPASPGSYQACHQQSDNTYAWVMISVAPS